MTGMVQGSTFCTGTEACWGLLAHPAPASLQAHVQPYCRPHTISTVMSSSSGAGTAAVDSACCAGI